MNKKDILEVRKQLSKENCAITRICGCYVTHEKEKKLEFTKAFLSLGEEEIFKYLEILKKTMSGTLGKNLMVMDFSLEAEADGTPHHLLRELRKSKLQDDQLLSEFYDNIIASYEYPENYYIVLVHSNYDVPGKSSDGMEMFDASDEVYEHLIVAICPVNLSKAGLSYNALTNDIEERVRDWIVEAPMHGFVFPAFTDRSSDLHSTLYYSKKPDELNPDFIEGVLGATLPLTAKDQKNAFDALISDTLEDECDFDTVKTLHENIIQLVEEAKENPDPVVLSKPEIKNLLAKSGADSEKLETFDNEFTDIVGEQERLMANNLTSTRSFEVKTPDVVVKVNPKRTDLVRTEEIDGRKCLVIEITDNLYVNGIDVNK